MAIAAISMYLMSLDTENSPNLNLYFVVCRSTKHKFTLLMSFCSLCSAICLAFNLTTKILGPEIAQDQETRHLHFHFQFDNQY